MMPRSTAMTAYDLLNDVVSLIREEPRRLLMSTWVARGRAQLRAWFGRRKLPACQTAACVAGWIVLLHDGVRGLPDDPDDIPDRAVEILGLPNDAVTSLFQARVMDDGCNLLGLGDAGYAAAVIDRIRRFQGKHEDVLHAQRLRRRR